MAQDALKTANKENSRKEEIKKFTTGIRYQWGGNIVRVLQSTNSEKNQK